MSNRKRSISLIDDSDDTASNNSVILERSSKRRRLNNRSSKTIPSDAYQHPHYLKFAPLLEKIRNSSYGHSSFNIDQDIMIDDKNMSNTKSISSNLVKYNKRLKRQNERLKNENGELKEKLRVLKNIATAFNSPKYGSIHIDKTHGSIASEGMALIKQKMLEKFNESRIVIKAEGKFRKAIKSFLRKNGNHINSMHNASNPFILVKEKVATKKKKKQCVYRRQRSILELKSRNTMAQSGHCHPNQMDILFDSFQLYASQQIMANTVVGEYYGLLLTEIEFDQIYKDSYFRDAANLYAFSQEIDVENIDHILISDDEEEDIDNGRNDGNHNNASSVIKIEDIDQEDDESTEDEAEDIEHDEKDNDNDLNAETLKRAIDDIKNHQNKFVIDALGYMNTIDNQDHLLMFTPDCRDDINQTEINDVEQNRINIEFVTAIINGFPRIFAISTRVIDPNEAICGYFGKEFTAAKYQAVKGKITRSRMIAQIDWVLNNSLIHLD